MRTITLDGPKARYDRLKLLPTTEDFGQELMPETTAPFTVRWNAEKRSLDLRLDETTVAQVKTEGNAGILHIRDAYPERFDFALLRAVRNVADLTDQVGKLKRSAEKDNGGDTGLFTRTPEAFTTKIQDVQQMHRALRGAESLNKKLSVHTYGLTTDDPYFKIEAHFGRASHNFYLYIGQKELRVRPFEGDAYGLRRESLDALLDAGLTLYEDRMVPERLEAACRKLLADTGNVDADTITTDYQQASKERNETVVSRFGPFTTLKRGYWEQHRFNGVRFAQATRDPLDALPEDLVIDRDLLRETVNALQLRWQAATINKRISDYPRLTEDLVATRIETVDFGYDM